MKISTSKTTTTITAESAGPSNTINIAINPNTKNHQKKRKCNRLDKFLPAVKVVEMVNEMPWDIDGDITYQMKSDADFWTVSGRGLLML